MKRRELFRSLRALRNQPEASYKWKQRYESGGVDRHRHLRAFAIDPPTQPKRWQIGQGLRHERVCTNSCARRVAAFRWSGANRRTNAPCGTRRVTGREALDGNVSNGSLHDDSAHDDGHRGHDGSLRACSNHGACASFRTRALDSRPPRSLVRYDRASTSTSNVPTLRHRPITPRG